MEGGIGTILGPQNEGIKKQMKNNGKGMGQIFGDMKKNAYLCMLK